MVGVGLAVPPLTRPHCPVTLKIVDVMLDPELVSRASLDPESSSIPHPAVMELVLFIRMPTGPELPWSVLDVDV